MSVYDGKPLLRQQGEHGESEERTCLRVSRRQQGEVIEFHSEAQAKLWVAGYRAWRNKKRTQEQLGDELKQLRTVLKGKTVEIRYTPKIDRPWRKEIES